MPEIWDVIVVGAGPAGSTAARIAAQAGARVLILDRARFPRYKTCGGGITGFSLRAMPDAARATFESEITDFGLSRRGRDRMMLHADEPFLGMVQRERFDQLLVDGAVAAGAVFRDGVAVRGFDEGADGVVVRTADREALRARVVIGADGSSGRSSGYVGVEFAGSDLGLEVELSVPEHKWAGTALFDWGADPGAYAWLFPKHDTLTIGVIQRTGLPDATRAYLELWLRQLGLAGATRLRESGHLTRWRSRRSPLRRGSVLVAGEAAGLLEPWTREGISFALRSGAMAGAAAASATTAARTGDTSARDAALEGYVDAVRGGLAPTIETGAVMLRWLEVSPSSLHRFLAHTALGRRLFLALCRGSTRVADLVDNPLVRLASRRLGGRGRPRTRPRARSRAEPGARAGTLP
ncbi:geranylgeranyl reductase family protein [Lysinimonas soli]|uniref:Geranylgeranyl reductase family protein n=1 Tax=Lysinimonas soli TaxID=1074233 RepID=A0ABW0NQ18_9MICO